jgi:DNA-binding PadR family transcriptional regulator
MSRHRHLDPDELERLAALRHFGGPSHFAGGPVFGGGRGRKRRGDVRLALLLLLRDAPRNGYQLMQEIEERSGGRWRPSPGSVYPTLQQLEDQALIRAVEHEGTKLYELTDAGRRHVSENSGGAAAPWEADADAPDIGDLKLQIKQLTVAAAQVMHAGDADQTRRASELVAQTRRALYRILAEETDA